MTSTQEGRNLPAALESEAGGEVLELGGPEPDFILADTSNPLSGLVGGSFFETFHILYWSPASVSDPGMSGSVATCSPDRLDVGHHP